MIILLVIFCYSGASVSIGGSACTVTTDTATEIVCTTGAHSGSVQADVLVDVSGQRANRVKFQFFFQYLSYFLLDEEHLSLKTQIQLMMMMEMIMTTTMMMLMMI